MIIVTIVGRRSSRLTQRLMRIESSTFKLLSSASWKHANYSSTPCLYKRSVLCAHSLCRYHNYQSVAGLQKTFF